jgi:hypothetical protein
MEKGKPNLVIDALMFFLLMAIAGCAAGFSYQSGPPTPNVPHITDVPPSFYDNDPALRHWYTYPYWNPNRDFFP